MSSDRARVFYGWWIVLTVALVLFLGPPPIMVFSFGVFLKALSREFHSGRAAISFCFTLHNLAGALCSPLAGRLVDRFGARRVIIPSTAIFGTILLSSQLCLAKIWHLYVFYLAVGIIGSGAGPVVYGIPEGHAGANGLVAGRDSSNPRTNRQPGPIPGPDLARRLACRDFLAFAVRFYSRVSKCSGLFHSHGGDAFRSGEHP